MGTMEILRFLKIVLVLCNFIVTSQAKAPDVIIIMADDLVRSFLWEFL